MQLVVYRGSTAIGAALIHLQISQGQLKDRREG